MNWKKAVSVMLVGIMALSMTACGDSGETSTDAASGGGSTDVYKRQPLEHSTVSGRS